MNCSQIEQMVAIRRAADAIIKETCKPDAPNFGAIGEKQDDMNQAIANARQGQGLSRLRPADERVAQIKYIGERAGIPADSGGWDYRAKVHYDK